MKRITCLILILLSGMMASELFSQTQAAPVTELNVGKALKKELLGIIKIIPDRLASNLTLSH